MKTYKLNGLEYYTVAFSVTDAVGTFWKNGIGVTEKNITETDIDPNRDAVGKVFKSLDELLNFEIEY
jgi:hypothetical protein